MKDCKKIHPLLSLYAEGELSSPDQNRVKAHLKACATARKELEGFARLAQALKRLPEPEWPRGLHERIMARSLDREKRPSLFGRFWVPGSLGLAAAAAVVVMLFVQSPEVMKGPPNLGSSAKPPEETAGNRPVRSSDRTAARPKGRLAVQSLDTNAGFGMENKIQEKEVPESGNEGLARSMAPAPRAKKSRVSKMETEMNLKAFGSSAGAPASSVPAAAPEPAAQMPSAQMKTLMGSEAGISERPAAQAAPNAFPQTAAPHEALTDEGLSSVSSRTLSAWNGGNGAPTASQELLTDGDSFKEKWQALRPDQPPPDVDFTSQAVVLLEAGPEPNPGYSIHVTQLEETAGRCVVHYRVSPPPAGALEAQVVIHPWCLRVIPKPGKPVAFVQDP